MDKESLPPELRDLADDEAMQEDYRTLWTLLQQSQADDASEFDVDTAWSDLAGSLDLDASPEATARSESRGREARSPSRSRSVRREGHDRSWKRAATAAAALVVLAVGALAWWSQPVTVATSPGEQTAVTLPDGSTVELNGGSLVTYARGFSSLPGLDRDVRQVQVEGEAYFEVTSSERPFRVQTPNATVSVLGTAFTVRSRARASGVETDVVLTKGRVRLDGASEASGVVLDRPGSRSRVRGDEGDPSEPTVIDLKYATAWRTGGFAARNARLPAILTDLEQQFGTTLRLGEDVAPGEPLTLHYGRSVALEDVLHDLCIIRDLSYSKTSDGYVIRRSSTFGMKG